MYNITLQVSHGRSLSAPAGQSTPASGIDEAYGPGTLFHETASRVCYDNLLIIAVL